MPDHRLEPCRGSGLEIALRLQGHADDADEREDGRLLVGGGRRDRHGCDDELAAAREEQGEGHEGDHDGVAVAPADEVHEDERVEHAEPEGVPTADAVALGEARQGVGEQPDRQERRHAHGQGRDVGVLREDADDEVLHLQRERTVGRRRVDPHRVDLVGEGAGHPERAHGIRVHPAQDDLSLRGVAVGVAAEERRREHDRQAPEEPRHRRGLAAVHGAHPQPRVDEQGHADGEQDRREDPSGARAEPHEAEALDERRGGQLEGVGGQEGGADGAGGHEGRAERAAPDHRVGPRAPERGGEAVTEVDDARVDDPRRRAAEQRSSRRRHDAPAPAAPSCGEGFALEVRYRSCRSASEGPLDLGLDGQSRRSGRVRARATPRRERGVTEPCRTADARDVPPEGLEPSPVAILSRLPLPIGPRGRGPQYAVVPGRRRHRGARHDPVSGEHFSRAGTFRWGAFAYSWGQSPRPVAGRGTQCF